MTIGYGLIGCGAFGRFCLGAISRMPDVQPIAVADVVKASADALAGEFGLAGYADAAELFARDDVDVVHVATPPSTHHDLALRALRAGKHVLCEKPLALTVADGEEMIRQVEAGELDSRDPAYDPVWQRGLRHQVGGMPYFIQGAEGYRCLYCKRDIPFIACIADPRGFTNNCGVQTIFHFCMDCSFVFAFQRCD